MKCFTSKNYERGFKLISCGQQPPLSLFWDLGCCTSIAASCTPSDLHQCWPPLLPHCTVDSSAGHITLAPHCDPFWVPSVNQGWIWHLPLSSIHLGLFTKTCSYLHPKRLATGACQIILSQDLFTNNSLPALRLFPNIGTSV